MTIIIKMIAAAKLHAGVGVGKEVLGFGGCNLSAMGVSSRFSQLR